MRCVGLRQGVPGRRGGRRRRAARQAEFELRVRPARPVRRTWHGDLPETREMLAPPCSGLDARACAASASRACKAVSADKAATGCPVARIVRQATGSSIQTGISWRRVRGASTRRAARHRAGRALDHLMKANPTPGPRMPSVENGDLVACGRTMGLVVRGCTTPLRPHSSLGYRPTRARGRPVAGCASPASSAGHPGRGLRPVMH